MDSLEHPPTFVRDCAAAFSELVDESGNDPRQRADDVANLIEPLLRHPDLYSLGVKREGNHVGGESVWLYFDGMLGIFVGPMPIALTIPAHNHGAWQTVAVYRGAIKHTQYDRVDDGSVAFYSRLEKRSDLIMRDGDIVCTPPPPNDIHSLVGLAESSYVLSLVGGIFAETRDYFDPHEDYYYSRHQGDLRRQREHHSHGGGAE